MKQDVYKRQLLSYDDMDTDSPFADQSYRLTDGELVKPETEYGAVMYIFGLEGDIYGKNIEVQILAFDRPEQKFTSLEELKERIEKDEEFANAYYERHPEFLVEK